MLIRQPYTSQALEALTNNQDQAVDAVQTFYGITASVGDLAVTNTLALSVLLGMVVVFIALGSWRIGRRIR